MTCALRRTYEIEDERRGPISVSRHAGKACVEPDCAFREPITISREERATPIADRLAAAAKELVRELEQRAQRREGDLSTVVRGRTHVAAVDLPERFCAVPGCKTRCRPAHLMCLPHWLRVPKALQRAVLRAFVPGQESGHVEPSDAHRAASAAAVEAVVSAEAGKAPPAPAPAPPQLSLFDGAPSR